MKKRLFVLVGALLLLVLVTGSVLAKGGASNGTFVRFMQTGVLPGVDPSYCEGFFLEASSGIVHEWRNNSECIPYAPYITETSLHLVFKPVTKFQEADCDDSDFVFQVPYEWTLTADYIDLADDEADLRDFLGQDDEQYWWVCFYYWDSD